MSDQPSGGKLCSLGVSEGNTNKERGKIGWIKCLLFQENDDSWISDVCLKMTGVVMGSMQDYWFIQ